MNKYSKKYMMEGIQSQKVEVPQVDHEKAMMRKIDSVANFLLVSIEDESKDVPLTTAVIENIIKNKMRENSEFWYTERVKQLWSNLLGKIKEDDNLREIINTIMKEEIRVASNRGIN